MSPRPEERLKEGMETHEHDRGIHDHRPRWRNQAGRLHAARERRFELQLYNSGEWVERTRWNEVTVFGEGTRGYVKRNIVKGDLIFTSGSMGQTKWEKDGETFYGVTLACERIERLCKGPNHGEDNGAEAQESRRPPVDDSDIPF